MKPPKIGFRDMYRHFCEETPKQTGPSSQYDKARSCLSKKAHATKELADAAAAHATIIDKEQYIAYKCRWCIYYHVGHAK